MTDPMTHLAQAVKVSAEIHQLREKFEDLPVNVREVESELKKITTEYEEKKTGWEELDTEKRRLETELQEDSQKLIDKEERLNSIKTQKEYQAVVREITTTKTANKSRKEKVKLLTENLETLQTDLTPLESKMQELKEQFGKEQSSIQGSLDSLQDSIKNLEKQLKEQLTSLPEEIRNKYLLVQDKKQPPAALVVDGTCQECFIHIPPQLYIELQKQHEVHSCPNCHRLLYMEFE